MIGGRLSHALQRLVGRRRSRRVEPWVSRGPYAIAHTDDATIAEADPTWVMRHSPYPMWAAMRTMLAERGIDPNTTAVADSFGLDPIGVEVGVLVTAAGRVIQFRYDDGFEEWTDVTSTWHDDASIAEQVERALAQLRATDV